MATAKQYWMQLRGMSRTISRRFGVDLQYADQNTRAIAAIVAAMFALLLKLLVDKGLITDAEIMAAWEDARDNNDWEAELPVAAGPTIPPPPETPPE